MDGIDRSPVKAYKLDRPRTWDERVGSSKVVAVNLRNIDVAGAP
jgi:hypothetical protein